MKTITKTLTVLLGCAVFNSPAFAESKDAPPPNLPHPGMGMGGMNEEQMDAHLRQAQETMLTNHDFMHQIRDAKDEKEKARLKDEWLKAMKSNMQSNQVPRQLMMHGMPVPPAPGK